MKIGIYAGTLRGLGTTIVGKAILNAIPIVDAEHTYVVWVPEEWSYASPAPERMVIETTQGGMFQKLKWEAHTLRQRIAQHRVERLFSLTDTTLPRCPIPHLLLLQNPYYAYPIASLPFEMPPAFRARLAVQDAWLRACLSTVDTLTVQTQHMRDAFVQRWNFPAERITVVPSSIQPHAEGAFDPEAPPSSPPYVAFPSAAAPQKNQTVLASMMAHLKADFPSLRCRLPVLPEQVPRLVGIARREGILDRFDLMGKIAGSEAIALLKGANVAVLPTQLESFGIPFWEAMALGKPIVASDVPCAREPLGEAALFAHPDDGGTWAKHVSLLLSDASVASQMSARARQRFLDTRWTWQKITRAYLNLIENL